MNEVLHRRCTAAAQPVAFGSQRVKLLFVLNELIREIPSANGNP